MESTARFLVDPRLAKLLGESYRSTERALKELVDNAWDADAEGVWVEFPEALSGGSIVIRDDGAGMTEAEVRKEYLTIANDRRSRKGDRTGRKQRLVKGRKGIGKFAGLMAAELMHIETRSRGTVTSLTVPKDDLLRSGQDLEGIDLLIETAPCDPEDHGTTVTLSQLNQNYAVPNVDFFKRLLILEYGRTEEFDITVNGAKLDIGDLPGKEFVREIDIEGVGLVRLRFKVSNGKQGLKQSGIAIRAGGKIVGDPIYFGVDTDEEIPSKLLRKVYGEIEADGLVDGTTADWGSIIENSNAFMAVEPWVREQLREGIKEVYRAEIRQTRAQLDREIRRRLEKMPEHRRHFAEAALQRVMRKFYGEKIERIEVVASVVLDALERDEYYAVVKKIDEARPGDIEALADALEEFGLVDLAVIGQQANGRLRFLDKLEDLIRNPETLEKSVHQAVENNLWVLGPEYSMLSSNKTTARTIRDYLDREFDGERASKRPDLLLANSISGRHLLVEFKRPSKTLGRDDENQAEKYRDDLTPYFGAIEILVIGKSRDPKIQVHYDKADLKLLSYTDVIARARTQHEWLLEELASA